MPDLNEELHLAEWDNRYCSQGDNAGKRKEKKYFTQAKGSFLIDEDNVWYLDFQMFNSAANFGYQSRIHHEAVIAQLEKLPCLANEFMHAERVRLSREIASGIEKRFGVHGRVHFTIGGALAVEEALKIVAIHQGTRRVFAFSGSYHGRSIVASSISSFYKYRRLFHEASAAYFVPFPYCSRCPYGKEYPGCKYYCVEQFRDLIETEANGLLDHSRSLTEYRAFVAEPILGRGGYIVPPPEYFSKLKQILDEYNILFIADEVQMGFYRTGKLWAIEHFGVCPDIVIFGKAITNGLLPLSGIWARNDLMEPQYWPPGSTHATFAAQPLAMAAALATFDLLGTMDFESLTANRGNEIRQCLQAIQDKYGIFGRIDSLGLAFGVEVCEPGTNQPDAALAKKIAELALIQPVQINQRRFGLILTLGGYHNNVLLLSPSLLMSSGEVGLFVELLQHYVEQSLAGARE